MIVSSIQTLVLGLIFVGLGSCRYVLIKFSANADGTYSYLPVTVNICAEIVKLVVCTLLGAYVFCTDKGANGVPSVDKAYLLNLLKWAVPGFLYFLDNILAFYVVKYFQPAVVVLLGNFVIITTSVLFRIILKRSINRIQWASLIILFLAIVTLSSSSTVSVDHHKHHAVNHLIAIATNSSHNPCSSSPGHFSLSQNATSSARLHKEEDSITPPSIEFNEGHILILIQCLISSLANIYNEKIFKEGDGMQDSIYVQNSKLYFFGVLFNFLTLVVHSHYRDKIIHCGFFYGHNTFSLVLIFTTAFYGLNVALILKFRDNMFYLLSSQLITVTVIAASMYFFDFDPNLNFFLLAPIVVLCIYIFNTSKAVSKVPSTQHTEGYRPLDDRTEVERFIAEDNMDE